MKGRGRITVLLLAAAVAGIAAVPSAVAAPDPIRANPRVVVFSAPVPYGETAVRTVTFENISDEPVWIGSLNIYEQPAEPAFHINDTCNPQPDPNIPPPGGTLLQPGEACSWEITFAPLQSTGLFVYHLIVQYSVNDPMWGPSSRRNVIVVGWTAPSRSTTWPGRAVYPVT